RVRTEEQLLTAVDALEEAGHKACFKPAAGAGARPATPPSSAAFVDRPDQMSSGRPSWAGRARRGG
ncbi:hypothetical protein, partial [Streptomyces sp. NPDC002205]|uniref:hypothetical protein n=1 Tax=Streptomyces sp. NPDC002205 TaxID=3154411 RepID=UPI0033329789